MSRASGETSWEGIALLRFFLAWVVFAGHLNLFTPEPSWLGAFDQFGGKAAVIGFLLVSGFSIASSIERQGEGFFRRRFLRIYPLYFTAIVFGFALEIWTGGQVTAPGRTFEALGWPTALGNLIFAQTFAVKPLGFDGPVWSLAIEVFYYALAPVFLLLERKWLLGIAVVSMVCYGLPRHTDWGFAYYFASKFNALIYMWCWLLGFVMWRERGPDLCRGPRRARLRWRHAAIEPHEIMGQLSRRPLLFALLVPLSNPHYGVWAFGVRSPGALCLMALAVSILALHVVDRFIKARFLKPLILGNPAAKPGPTQPASLA